jgi:hypothetical protein
MRDAKICILWSRDGHSMEEIGRMFNLSATRINTIIYKNHEFIKIDKIYEKNKRINHLRRLLRKHPENLGTKTTLDILESLKTEVDGKEGTTHSGETKIIIIRPENKIEERIKSDGVEAHPQPISRQISI